MYAGQPPAVENYDTITSNGIKVFVPKNAVTASDGIKISMVDHGSMKVMRVDGLSH